MTALTALLHEDATLSMPPFDLWLRGHDDIVGWMLGVGSACRGSRLLPTVANGTPAFAHYHPDPDGRVHPVGADGAGNDGGKVSGITSFLDTARWFPLFDLPARLDGRATRSRHRESPGAPRQTPVSPPTPPLPETRRG